MQRPAPILIALMLAACSCSRHAPDGANRAAADTVAMSAAKSEAAAAPATAPAPMQRQVDAAGANAAADAATQSAESDGIDRPGVRADDLGSATPMSNVGPRRFIRAAQIDCQVGDVLRSASRIEDLAGTYGGFVTRNDVGTEIGAVQRRAIGNGRLVELATYTVQGSLQVRVPSDRAQAFLRSLAGEMDFLDHRHFEAVDAQFDLLRRQLARQRHDQAQRSLGDATAQGGRLIDKTEAIDARQQQQTERDEALIEQRTFEDRVEFATLDISMRQPERVRRSERPDVEAILRHEGPGFLNRVGDSLANGWRAVLDVLVLLTGAWPLWILAASGGVALRGWRGRRVG